MTMEENIPSTKFTHHSAHSFQTWPELCTHIRREVLQAQSSTEIAYTSVLPSWGPLIVDSLDNNADMESLNAAIDYNSVTETLRARVMPTRLLGCHLNWMRIQEDDWREGDLVKGGHLALLTVSANATHQRFNAPYSASRKTPHFCMKPDNQYHPSFVIECGDGGPECRERLLDDMRLWLVGGRPFVKVVVIIQYQYQYQVARRGSTSQVQGRAELYVRDGNGEPVLRQEAIIFPATQSECSCDLGISAGELFGAVLPQGLAASTVLPLSIGNLRNEASDAMVSMDVVPAT